ncbi:FAD/NAD(P)-binding protein [Agrobacterium rubi]|uniref:FAD-dependent pyridine nucleotide-disulfide oxidoreductase n=1 Tax=Agrobacterium rubi TaxID=28099 RepID=A0AAE7R9R3_9HYPH|nr:FAD/NAD(P)-binding protein [Agrobacterium rubi]NTE88474.1 FAD-dependent pyridine nucleotide-disulfide oxidoreductase [Agrobacterium rubi]NTF04240.1 FAD-dependent pyridine nucleotide-disulfide oxidoreductase [Agrobacterium rubi]NTF38571.1 FAD-dependent pyridine nucleotide-disulfide oxidoreductase [Agrobacterium rubi]OCJ47227.1 FAD-dependent pyridine nucleotide-disulfide oxidoreductase [Agrobacterium rubi]QTG02372.1 FAD-dependent pyridine nucleotide-disulfide oxidoreductase [Agrobacterium rub
MFYDVAVVGSGFSAISLVTNLLEQLPATTSIAIVGDDSAFGRGTAYRTELHLHRLNVPAARMSVFADRPEDFLDWLAKRGQALDGTSFAPRNDYGLYLRDRLASLLRSQHQRARVDFVKAKAVSCLSCTQEGADFRLNDGRHLHAANVALCLGVGTASLPRLTADADVALLRRVVRNPWKLGWLSKVRQNDTAVILGSGLTMIDQVLSLRNKGHRGPIHVLSRRGLVPHGHSKMPSKPIEPTIDGLTEISAILSRLRRQVRDGADWRSIMDGLRPKTQHLWQQLSVAQRARFLRHALAWWNIHRHRIAPQVHKVFDALVKDGTVQIHAGFVSRIARANGENSLTYRRRGSSDEITLPFDWLINCTGMERAGISHSPLLQDMLAHNMIETDPLGLGIRVDGQSRIVSGEGSSREGMFAVGALTAGQFWEITAVPDIRVQTRNVAEAIAQRINHTGSQASISSAF